MWWAREPTFAGMLWACSGKPLVYVQGCCFMLRARSLHVCGMPDPLAYVLYVVDIF